MTLFRKSVLILLIVFLAISSVVKTNNNLIFFLSLFLNLLICGQIILVEVFQKKYFLPKHLLIFLIWAIFFIAVGFSSSGILTQLENFQEGYKFDGFLFLNTAQLIKGGQNYWSAYTKAFEEDIRFETAPDDFWGWRLPVIFYLWSLAPSSFWVWASFLILATLTLFVSFKINQDLGNLAILTPILLAPYFFFGAVTEWFLEIEWWGLFVFIFGLYFFQIGKLKIAWILFLLAIFVRELFIIPIFTNFLVNLVFDRKKVLFFGLLLVIFALFLFVHFLILKNLLEVNLESFAARRLWFGGFGFIQQTLAFGSNYYLFINLRVFALYALLVFLGTILVFLKDRFKIFQDLVFVSLFSFVAFYFFAGTPRWHEYWGITYIPLMILLLPKILKTVIVLK